MQTETNRKYLKAELKGSTNKACKDEEGIFDYRLTLIPIHFLQCILYDTMRLNTQAGESLLQIFSVLQRQCYLTDGPFALGNSTTLGSVKKMPFL